MIQVLTWPSSTTTRKRQMTSCQQEWLRFSQWQSIMPSMCASTGQLIKLQADSDRRTARTDIWTAVLVGFCQWLQSSAMLQNTTCTVNPVNSQCSYPVRLGLEWGEWHAAKPGENQSYGNPSLPLSTDAENLNRNRPSRGGVGDVTESSRHHHLMSTSSKLNPKLRSAYSHSRWSD